MQVHEAMSRNVELVNPGTPLREVARRMQQLEIGALPVGEGERLVGMVTDRDLVVRGLAQADDLQNACVRECMTPQVLYCFDDQPLDEVAASMAENQVRRLPVVSRDKRLVGIVALADIAGHADTRRAGDTLREISQ